MTLCQRRGGSSGCVPRLALGIAAAAASFAATAAQESPEGCQTAAAPAAVSCPGGQAPDAQGICSQCPEGKQSPNGTASCQYCRNTLIASDEQDRCVCDTLNFNVWGGSSDDAACSPCAEMKVIRNADIASKNVLDEVTEFIDASTAVDKFAVSCHGPSVGVKAELINKQGEERVNEEFRGAACGKHDHCECAGGPMGDAQLCPNNGYWLHPTLVKEMQSNGTTPSLEKMRSAYYLYECFPTRGGGPSRCQHWSRCIQEADTDTGINDPWSPYVDDEEFADWLLKDPNNQKITCVSGLAAQKGEVRDLRDEECWKDDDTCTGDWDFMRTDGINCCAPGFMGPRCDSCIPPLMKINDACVKCEAEGLASINWSGMIVGVGMAFGFTIFLMRKAAMTFKDADGTATIAIFYFQVIALMFKDRAKSMAMPFLMDLLVVMEMGFLTNSERTCMVKLTFYENFYFSILSTVLVVVVIYCVIVALTSLTAEEKDTAEHQVKRLHEAKKKKVANHIIQNMTLFEHLGVVERDKLVAAMTGLDKLKKGDTVIKEGEKEFFIIVVEGKCSVQRGGAAPDTVGAGQHTGVECLFHAHRSDVTIKALEKETTLMTIKRPKFKGLDLPEKPVTPEANPLAEDEIDDGAGTGPAAEPKKLAEMSRGRAAKGTKQKRSRSRSPGGTPLALGDEHEYGEPDDYDKIVEAEASVDRVFTSMFQKTRRKIALETEVEETGCRANVKNVLKIVTTEMKKLYHASQDPTGRITGLLEAFIALYGPVTLQAMSILFCRTVVDTELQWTEDMGGRRTLVPPDVDNPVTKSVLVVDSSEECNTPRYYMALVFGCAVLFVFIILVPAFMVYSSKSFYNHVDSLKQSDAEAKALAKERYHSHWKDYTKEERHAKIEECAHELRLQMLGSTSFLMSTFQMSVNKEANYWYPSWYLLRRALLNFVYFYGLKSGDGTFPMVVGKYDWRVVVAIIFVVSSVLQDHYNPFRSERESNLEKWCLHFLTVVVIVDIADQTKSVYLCMVLSGVFAFLTIKDIIQNAKTKSVAEKKWHSLRKLQVGTVEHRGADGLMQKVGRIDATQAETNCQAETHVRGQVGKLKMMNAMGEAQAAAQAASGIGVAHGRRTGDPLRRSADSVESDDGAVGVGGGAAAAAAAAPTHVL